jgi:hypothetical protein
VTLARLTRGDVVAAVAALALLLLMSADWYSDKTGEDARRNESLAQPRGAEAGEVTRNIREGSRITAEEHESNAWQAGGALDGLILVILLAAVGLALAAAAFRVAGRRPPGPLGLSALAAAAAAVGAVLIAYRIVQEPGLDESTVVKAGAPLSLAAAVILALGAARAARDEQAAEEAGAADAGAQAAGTEPTEAPAAAPNG